MLSVQNLSLKYDNSCILDNINLNIHEGEIYGIIGASGAGKTSLIRCLAGLERAFDGEITVNSYQINDKQKRYNRKQSALLGVVFQGYNLLMQKTVFDNIALPLLIAQKDKAYIQLRVNELLKLIGLENKAYTYPAKLSGGQKQRVAIARALANNPKVLLLDEITSALDPLNSKAVMHLLKRINEEQKVTIILITHEINIVRMLCERVCVINDGKKIEEGTVGDVFSNPKCSITKLLLGRDEL